MKVKVMISLRMSLTVPLLFLIFISGVGAQDWGVNYRRNSICALKGSTVNMGCTYSYPPGHTVQTAFWSKELVRPDFEPPDLLKDEQYKSRVQYIGDKQNDCRLSLRDVRENDQSKYYFRFITDKPGGKYQGKDGVTLSVTGLQVEVPERVMEGDKVTLTCKTTCGLTDSPSFTWYRNGAPLLFSTERLYLQWVSREDAGRYSCAVLDQNLQSPEVTLNVLYPPKSVSVSISPSGEIDEGSSVTLTCSSDGNPPVQNYTWFKDGGSSPVGSEHSYSFILDSESSGQYYCEAENKHGSKRSDAVLLSFKGNVNVTLYVIGGVVVGCVGLILVLVILFLRKKKKNKRRKEEEHDYQNAPDPKAQDDTYTALNPMSRSSNDVYDTLNANADPNAQDDTYTVLNPESRSSNDVYHTLNATVHSSPSDDAYTALDPQSRSPEYDTLAVTGST